MKFLKTFEEINFNKDITDSLSDNYVPKEVMGELEDIFLDLEEEGGFKISVNPIRNSSNYYSVDRAKKSLGHEHREDDKYFVIDISRDKNGFNLSEVNSALSRIFDFLNEDNPLKYDIIILEPLDRDIETMTIKSMREILHGFTLSSKPRGGLHKGEVYLPINVKAPGWWDPQMIKIGNDWYPQYLFTKLSNIKYNRCAISISYDNRQFLSNQYSVIKPL